MGKYIYTNRSTPDELQRYLNAIDLVGVELYRQAGYEIGEEDGRAVIYGKLNGQTDKRAKTLNFDIVKPKYGENGFYCLNAREYYKNRSWVSLLPDHEDYVGLYDTDDISQWREPVDHGL
jgi:hypothetical protein